MDIDELRTKIQDREDAMCAERRHRRCAVQTEHVVPDADPRGPREKARVLSVLGDPGKFRPYIAAGMTTRPNTWIRRFRSLQGCLPAR